MSGEQLAGILKSVFKDLSEGPKQKNTQLVDLWVKIVGAKIAAKTKIRFNREGIIVTSPSSTLSYELSQKYGGTILKRFQNEFGESEIKTIKFFVGENR